MEENVIQINCGIATNPDVSGKNMCERNYIWNPTTCSYKNGKYLVSIIDSSVITCDTIIDAEETKTFWRNIAEKIYNLWNTKFTYFTCLFINYHCIIESC